MRGRLFPSALRAVGAGASGGDILSKMKREGGRFQGRRGVPDGV